MRPFIISFCLILITSVSYSQTLQNDSYQFFVDLNNADNDELAIELITPKISSDKVLYRLPAMVPGTYKIYDFGRFISDFKAFDESGNELAVTKPDINTWEISDAGKLFKITYIADDSFDDTTGTPIFEPAGTSIEEGKIFVINNHGFFGYFEGYIDNDYELKFMKPSGFFGSTSLTALDRTDSEETFAAPDYHYLVDNPIFFNVPDTSHIHFDEADVLISVYSPGKGITSKDIAENDQKLLEAIRNYLGGKLPTDRYTFLYYFTDQPTVSGMFGALEHNNSSLYFMPDVPKEAKQYMLNQLQSTSSHEFYHTVTPLNLHSVEIGDFDFNNPVMSEHLWLYEGVTEYSAHYIMLREGLITLDKYLEEMDKKLNTASRYNDTLPFTVMSKGALREYENQYQNVYEKGALIGMCLDILIREESNGQTGLQDVINKLQEKYGKEKAFIDDDLFSEIELLTSPKVREFLDRYVGGPEKIPYKEIFGKVGISFDQEPYQVIDFGGLQIGFDSKTYRLQILKIEDPDNKFVKALGIKTNDELVSVNGKPITFQNARSIFGSASNQIKEGDKIKIEVARTDAQGKETVKELSATVSKTKTAYNYAIGNEEKLTDNQLKIRDAWLGKN